MMREHHDLASLCNGIGLFYETPEEKKWRINKEKDLDTMDQMML